MITVQPLFSLIYVALLIVPVFNFTASPETKPVQFHTVTSIEALIERSDLIAVGTLEPAYQSQSIEQNVNAYHLINTKQFFKSSETWKGAPVTQVTLLSTGLKPLPKARSPLNLKYPGELAKGKYVLFLKHVGGTPYFQLATGMQSVYPIYKGKSISFVDAGLPELNQLSLKTFREKVSQSLKNK